jgi:hypothetical protein
MDTSSFQEVADLHRAPSVAFRKFAHEPIAPLPRPGQAVVRLSAPTPSPPPLRCAPRERVKPGEGRGLEGGGGPKAPPPPLVAPPPSAPLRPHEVSLSAERGQRIWGMGELRSPIPQKCHPLPLQDTEGSRDKPRAGGAPPLRYGLLREGRGPFAPSGCALGAPARTGWGFDAIGHFSASS